VTPSADIRIQVTETDPGTRAQAAIRAGHHRLLCALRPKVALLTELRLGSDAREAAWDGLVDFCTGTVRRHLSATDHALYTPAADAAATRLLVRALRAVPATSTRRSTPCPAPMTRMPWPPSLSTRRQSSRLTWPWNRPGCCLRSRPCRAPTSPPSSRFGRPCSTATTSNPLPSTSPRLRSRGRPARVPAPPRRACTERGAGRGAGGDAPAISPPSRSRGGSACRGAGGGR
jgi:hypothetical protein